MNLTGVYVALGCTSQQAVVGLSPRVTVLTGQDAHRLLVRLPGLSPDPQQLAVDLTLCHPRAVAVVNLQLEELEGEKNPTEEVSHRGVGWWCRRSRGNIPVNGNYRWLLT